MDGGGQQQQPVQQQTNISELPEWAKPYAQRTLAKGEALTETPYQTYEAPRIAGFSPLQEQAFQGAANLGPTQQTAMGSNLAAAAGLGGLGTGYQAGRFSGGQFGGRQAAQYMNPYLEQALAPQIAEAQRQAGITATQQAGQAVGAGAFGGSRYGLQQAELQRNLGQNISNIVGQGYNQAFQQAQQQFNADQARRLQAQQLGEQSRQFGAGLGLQGLQTGLQAAGALGNLGQQQFAQQQSAIQAQQQAGGQQQALEQQGLTQAYQDFLNQQNYPYKQLGYMSDLIRGLPLGQQSTASIYQAPGSITGQLAGLGIGAYGLSRAFAKDGGLMESYKKGGITGDDNTEKIIDDLSDVQLAQSRAAAVNARDQKRLAMIDEEYADRAMEKSLSHGLGNAFDSLPPDVQDTYTGAGGGIVAFDDGGEVLGYNGEETSLVDLGVSPEFGGYSTPEETSKRSASEVGSIIDALKAQGKTVGLSDYYDIRDRKGRYESAIQKMEKAAAIPAEAPLKETPYDPATATRRENFPETPTAPSTSGSSISSALSTLAAKHNVPKEDLAAMFKKTYDELSAEDAPLLKKLDALTAKTAGRADEARKNMATDALIKFGFGLASAASRPGARALESISEASPLIAKSVAESQKAIKDAEDAHNKLSMEQAKFQMALNKGNRTAAMQHATNIRTLEIESAKLDQHAQQLAIQAKQVAQLGEYQQASLKQRGEQFEQIMGVRDKSATAALENARTNRMKLESVARMKFESDVAPRLNREFTTKYGKNWSELPVAQADFQRRRQEYISGQAANVDATPFSSFLDANDLKFIGYGSSE